MITADQLIAHLVGDYLLQSDWMANGKTKNSWIAGQHALIYTLPFLLLTSSWPALIMIAGTHFLIDRYRLARYVVYAKNWWFGMNCPSWSECRQTGYPNDRPVWLSTWLLIIADNVIHILINGLAIAYL